LIIYSSVNVKTLYEHGKDYPWPKPKRCPKCKGRRLWGHRFATRCFIGFLQKLWVKKYCCPDCGSVHTMRPSTHWSRFQYCVFVILWCLLNKIKHNRWRSSYSRQNQQYWFKGLIIQSSRHKNTQVPTIEVLRKLILKPVIPVSHSRNSEILRL
jgi:hypothetical protein